MINKFMPSWGYRYVQLWRGITTGWRKAFIALFLLSSYGWADLLNQPGKPGQLELNIILTLLLLWICLQQVKRSPWPELSTWLVPQCHKLWNQLDWKKRMRTWERFCSLNLTVPESRILESATQESGTSKSPTLGPPQRNLHSLEDLRGPLEPFAGTVEYFQGSHLKPHPGAIRGEVALVTLAGGQATRLGIDKPKGCLEISPQFHRSLFEIQASYLRSLKAEGAPWTPWAIMTSYATDKATREYFKEHAYFGLDPHHVDFFIQSERPFTSVSTNMSGKIWIDESGQICSGPDGNGAVFHHLSRAPIWKKWKTWNLRAVVVLPIDNPLAYPFENNLLDPLFRCSEAVIAAAVVERSSSEEKVGVFASQSLHPYTRHRVVEYSELSPLQASGLDEKGHLSFCWANTGILAWSFCAVEAIVARGLNELPLHHSIKRYCLNGKMEEVIKEERFIFDWLHVFASRSLFLVCYPREWIFAPVKGPLDIALVQAAIIRRDQLQLENSSEGTLAIDRAID